MPWHRVVHSKEVLMGYEFVSLFILLAIFFLDGFVLVVDAVRHCIPEAMGGRHGVSC